MPTLIAFISKDERVNNHVKKLIENLEWENIILIKDKTVMDIEISKEVKYINIDNNTILQEIILFLKQELKKEMKDTEAGINFIAGSGKEHMALLSALLKLGMGIRLVAYTKEGVREV